MGEDKAFANLTGRVLVSYPIEALNQAGASEVLAVGGDTERLGALGLEVVPDEHPGSGPLGAIIAGLERAQEATVVVLGCDQPAMTASAIDQLLDRLWATGADAVVPLIGDRPTAIGGAYLRGAAPILRTQFERGERTVHRALEALSVELFVPSDEDAFVDVDSPDELRRYAASDRSQRGKRG